MKTKKSLFEIKNKVVVITGASRGIGLHASIALSELGAIVIGVARSDKVDLSRTINFEYIKCDIRNSKKLEAIFLKIFDKYGRIDSLINAAGISLPFISIESELNRFKDTIDINLNATFACCNVVGKYMEKMKSGTIINITSLSSEQGFPNNPGYAASKGGIKAFTKSLAIDLGSKGIRVNCVIPGYIKTDMTINSFNQKKTNKDRLERIILNRWGDPDDLIGAFIFLISDASKYITGIDLPVDGGWLAKGL
jgi:NAD(P)-dependent dehydrogenase (short-subunit alcohol dehydrogenase family)